MNIYEKIHKKDTIVIKELNERYEIMLADYKDYTIYNNYNNEKVHCMLYGDTLSKYIIDNEDKNIVFVCGKDSFLYAMRQIINKYLEISDIKNIYKRVENVIDKVKKIVSNIEVYEITGNTCIYTNGDFWVHIDTYDVDFEWESINKFKNIIDTIKIKDSELKYF